MHTWLKSSRKLLFFDVKEAAHSLGSVSRTTWQSCEGGKFSVPANVVEKIKNLLTWRSDWIRRVRDQIWANPEAEVPLLWYDSLEDWVDSEREAVLWRPQQSVLSHILSEFPESAFFVRFEKEKYFEWLGDRLDAPEERAEWAGLQGRA